MMTDDPRIAAARAAREKGRFAQALGDVQALFADANAPISLCATHYFGSMLEWQLLCEVYPPASVALRVERDEQIGRLQRGDLHVGPPGAAFADGTVMRTSRFSVIARMNDVLQDPQSTAALFSWLDATHPALAREYAYRGLPALAATGDYALAERYLDDPLRLLGHVNQEARIWPLFPPAGQAPRVAASLMGLVGSVHIGMTVLAGLGRDDAAHALRGALLDGLELEPLRALAQRDLDEPGTVQRAIVAHQMALDDGAVSPQG